MDPRPNGAAYGDDAQSATNYPLVRLFSLATGTVAYAPTADCSSGVADLTQPKQLIHTRVHIPSDIPPGPIYVEVVVNGISSKPVFFEIE